MKWNKKTIVRFVLFAAFLLIACTSVSQEQQIRNNDTLYLIENWRLKNALIKFERLNLCEKRLQNSSQIITLMESRKAHYITALSINTDKQQFFELRYLESIKTEKQYQKTIFWLKMQRIGLIALIVVILI